MGPTDEDMREATDPDGFVAQDGKHGFGVMTLRLFDEMEEMDGEPKLYVQGDRMRAEQKLLFRLADAIQNQIDMRRQGKSPSKTPQQQIREEMEKEYEPYVRENERLKEEVQRLRANENQLLQILGQQTMPAPKDDVITTDRVANILTYYFEEVDLTDMDKDEITSPPFELGAITTAIKKSASGKQ